MTDKKTELLTFLGVLSICLHEDNKPEYYYMCNTKHFGMSRETIQSYAQKCEYIITDLDKVTLEQIKTWFAFNRPDYFYSIAICDDHLADNTPHHKVTHIHPTSHRSDMRMWHSYICKLIHQSLEHNITFLRYRQNLHEKNIDNGNTTN